MSTEINTLQEAPPPFLEFPKIARFMREIVVTEKIDGTNAQLLITESGDIFTASRTRWITPAEDNYGFARWVEGNKETLLKLGPGRHFGEWWGSGCQRGYGLPKGEKRFSLFNVVRWCEHGKTPRSIPTQDPRITKTQDILPAGLLLVPELYRGLFSEPEINVCMERLESNGSYAAPGFLQPEGIIVFRIAANMGFKRTLKNDGPKSIG